MLYGAGSGLIADMTGMTTEQARAFLKLQRETFHLFFAWSDQMARRAVLCKPLTTMGGWTLRFRPGASAPSPERTGRNFRVQASAAFAMRLLMIRLTEANLSVCAAIHDGFLLECGVAEADAVLKIVIATMDQCAVDLIGAPIPVKHQIFRYPECYDDGDPEANKLFDTIMGFVAEAEGMERGRGNMAV